MIFNCIKMKILTRLCRFVEKPFRSPFNEITSNHKVVRSDVIFKNCFRNGLHMQNGVPLLNGGFPKSCQAVTYCGYATNVQNDGLLTSIQFEDIAEETLQSMTEHIEEILDSTEIVDFDVNYSNGVLNVNLGEHGTYVINKQTPNKQIWLSSPISGPKRYDFIQGTWIYKHNGTSLHKLLSDELSIILTKKTDFNNCSYSN